VASAVRRKVRPAVSSPSSAWNLLSLSPVELPVLEPRHAEPKYLLHRSRVVLDAAETGASRRLRAGGFSA
jgi:hypothetical protein